MPGDARDVVAQVRDAIDIADVAQDLMKVPFKRQGDNFFALCPFHREKTPSFSVNVARQSFHCFGCQKGGDVFTLVMELERLSFREALESLAARAGIALPSRGGPATGSRLRSFELLERAARFYRARLASPAGGNARAYLERRGLDAPTMERFGVGFAPDDWRALLQAMRKEGFKDDELLKVGLVRAKERSTYDLLRNRVVIPIRDARGRAIGFGGRVLDDSEPKYLNSPETELFAKRSVLFAFDVAQRAAAERGFFVVVEGYMDAIAAHQCGLGHVVATLGTALTREHARAMARFAPRVVLLFDGDAGGLRASDRGAPLLLAEGLDVSVVALPDGLDPDDFLRRHGPEGFLTHLDRNGEELIDYLIRRARDHQAAAGGVGGEARAAREVVKSLAEVQDPLVFDLAVRRVAAAFGLAEDLLRYEAGRARTGEARAKGAAAVRGSAGRAGPPAVPPGRAMDEIFVLAGIVSDPFLAERALRTLSEADFQDAGRRQVFECARILFEAGRTATSSVILERTGKDGPAAVALREILSREVPSGDSPEQALQRLVARRDEEEYRRLLSDVAAGQDDDAENRALLRISEFNKKRFGGSAGDDDPAAARGAGH